MKTRITLSSILSTLLDMAFAPVPRSRSQLGGLDLGAKEIIELVEEVKAAATGTTDQIDKIGKSQQELATRMQQLEQKGPAGADMREDRPDNSPSSIILKSPELARLRSGEVKSIRIPVKGFQTKATVLSGSVNAAMPAGEVFGVLGRRLSLRSIIPVLPTSAGSVDFIQSTQSGVAGVQAVEGSLKPQIDLGPVLVNAPVVTVAAFVDVSNQMLSDNAAFGMFIATTLQEAVAEAEEVELLNGPGGAGRMAGLMGAASAYSRGVTGDTAVDTLRRASTQVGLQRGRPDAMVISPELLERVELLKTADGEYVVQLVVDVQGRTVIWRLAVIVSDALGTNEFLVGAFGQGAILYDRMAMIVEVSDQAGFKSNVSTVRCESRLALALTRPQCFVKGTVS